MLLSSFYLLRLIYLHQSSNTLVVEERVSVCAVPSVKSASPFIMTNALSLESGEDEKLKLILMPLMTPVIVVNAYAIGKHT
jgi:hypothetical protein